MVTKKNLPKMSDDDLTRIEDLPPLDHPPLPQLPTEPSSDVFTLPHVPQQVADNVDFAMDAPLSSPQFELPQPEGERPIQSTSSSSSTSFTELNQFVQEAKDHDHFDPTLTNVKTAIPTPKSVEIFSDIKEELETFVLKHVPFESYPSYSLYISNIKNGLQKKALLLLLKEYGLFQTETENALVQRSLQQGHLLIPRISEYAAIYFANILELQQVHIKLTPSEDLTQHHEAWDQGPLTEQSFKHHDQMGTDESLNEIFLTQSFYVSGKKITLLGHLVQQSMQLSDTSLANPESELFANNLHNNLNDLKIKATELNANAIVGISFQKLNDNTFLVTGEAAQMEDEQ